MPEEIRKIYATNSRKRPMVKRTLKSIELFSRCISDPEIPGITIKELGILRGIDFVDNNYVVTISPTYTACPAMGLMENQVKEHLAKHGITNVKVNLTYSPAWTIDWMNDETKKKLKNYKIAPPQHLSCRKSLNTNMKICRLRRNSVNTEVKSYFGSTACKELHSYLECKEPFEYFKCH